MLPSFPTLSLLMLLAWAPEGEAAPAPAPAPAAEAPAETVAEAPVAEAPETEATPAAPALDAQPLPDAPPRVDPGTLDPHAWRGRGFFQIHIGAIVPLGGSRPGAGTVASAGGGVQVGWRIRPVFGLGVGVTTFLHDHAEQLAVDSVGDTVKVRDFGRLTLFDPLFARFWIPTRRRVEPRFDAGVLLGSYRPPFEGGAKLAAGARVGAGVDVWIGPSFSLDFGVDPRLIVIDGRAGVTLQAGMGATVHW